jgi:ComEC/Rec2-related protein
MKRPLAWPALLFIAGIMLGDLAPVRFGLWLGAGLALAVGAGALLLSQVRGAHLSTRSAVVLLSAAIITAGAAAVTLRTQIVGPNDLRSVVGAEPRIVSVRGRIVEAPYQRFYDDRSRTLTKVKADQLRFDKTEEWLGVAGTIAVVSRGDPPEHLWPGQHVEITGVLSQPESALAPGLFDYRAYLQLLGIHYHLRADGPQDWQVLGSRSPPAGTRFNTWAKRTLARGLPHDEALQLLWAMTLGWKTALNGEVSEPFMRSGTLHVFAISGLHVAMIAAIFAGILRACLVPRRICGIVVIAVTWFYTYATDWQPSAVRSAVMASVFMGSWVIIRPPDVYNSLATAALIILVCDPQQLFQAGFQLSFAVVLGLILVSDSVKARLRIIGQGDPLVPWDVRPRWQRWTIKGATYVTGMAITSAAAFLASIPLIAHYFHLLTPVSLIANLLVVPMSGGALASNLVSLLCGAWAPGLAEIFNHGAWFWMKAMLWVSEWTARWPGAAWHVSAPGPFVTALYYVVLVALCAGWFGKTRFRRYLVAGIVILAVLTAIDAGKRLTATTLTIVPLGAGHAVYLDAPAGRPNTLIDCGHERPGKITLKPFLQSRGVNSLAQFALTHGDANHVGGFETVVDYFAPQQVIVPAVRFSSPFYRKAIRTAEQRSLRPIEVATGAYCGGWIVLHPAADDRFPQADDKALVLTRMFKNGTRVLLLGDLGPAGQKTLAERARVRADIVVTSMPSESEPLLDSLLDKIQPRIIVVADAIYPSDARARPALRERLAKRAATVFYTSERGAITIDLDSSPARVVPTREPKVSELEPTSPPQSSSEE